MVPTQGDVPVCASPPVSVLLHLTWLPGMGVSSPRWMWEEGRTLLYPILTMSRMDQQHEGEDQAMLGLAGAGGCPTRQEAMLGELGTCQEQPWGPSCLGTPSHANLRTANPGNPKTSLPQSVSMGPHWRGVMGKGVLHSPQPMRMYHQMYLLSEVKVSSSRVCKYMPSTSSQ